MNANIHRQTSRQTSLPGTRIVTVFSVQVGHKTYYIKYKKFIDLRGTHHGHESETYTIINHLIATDKISKIIGVMDISPRIVRALLLSDTGVINRAAGGFYQVNGLGPCGPLLVEEC